MWLWDTVTFFTTSGECNTIIIIVQLHWLLLPYFSEWPLARWTLVRLSNQIAQCRWFIFNTQQPDCTVSMVYIQHSATRLHSVDGLYSTLWFLSLKSTSTTSTYMVPCDLSTMLVLLTNWSTRMVGWTGFIGTASRPWWTPPPGWSPGTSPWCRWSWSGAGVLPGQLLVGVPVVFWLWSWPSGQSSSLYSRWYTKECLEELYWRKYLMQDLFS